MAFDLPFFDQSPPHRGRMKISELIAELQRHDPEKMVVMPGYEGGFNEVKAVKTVQLKLNVNTRWFLGKHEENANGDTAAILIL